MTDKKALTPEEFAAAFGREKSWSYRQLYAGKIVAVTGYGRLMIPASEVTRLESEGARYRGKKAEAKPTVKDNPPQETAKLETNPQGGEKWMQAVQNRRKSPTQAASGKNVPPVVSPALKRIFRKGLPPGNG